MALTLGIDIGKRSVRGAVIKTGLRSVEIDRYLEVPVSALETGAPQVNLVNAALRELLAQLPDAPDSVVVAIGGARASLRVVEIPLAAKKRASEVLPFELDPLLPFPIDEALVDYQEVGPRGTSVALLAAAVPESVVAEALESLAQAGVNPREIAVGGAALDGLSPYLGQPPDEAWLLVHFDADHTDVCVLRAGACELARTLDEGARALAAGSPALRNALSQTVMKYRADGGPLINRLVVMGEGADDPRLTQWLGESLGLPAEPVNLPLTRHGSTPPAPTFGRALALAARVTRRGKRIDMRRGKYAVPRGVSQLREYAALATVCAVALVFSYTFRVWAEYRVLGEERDALQEKLAEITEQQFGESTRSPKRARELLEGGGQAKDPLPRFDALRVLAAISSAVPAGVTHDTRKLEIELDETGQMGTFELQGQIPDLTARDQVADALDAHECIEQLERGKTSTVPGQERKSYTLEGVIACPGAAKPKPKSGQAARGSK